VQVAERDSSVGEVQQKPAPKQVSKGAEKVGNEGQDARIPKRRGRPPKMVPNAAPLNLQSPSPPQRGPAPVKKLLSLKEKLALKGKSFKIVAAKPRQSLGESSAPQSAKIIPSIRNPVLKSPSIGSPASSNTTNQAQLSSSKTSPASVSIKLSDRMSTPIEALISSKEPANRGPTVVRLMSPDSEFEETKPNVPYRSGSDDSSSDDDDASIPAVRASPKPYLQGGVSLRGRGAIRGGMKARRGRPPMVK
jgi:hypothetical protein